MRIQASSTSGGKKVTHKASGSGNQKAAPNPTAKNAAAQHGHTGHQKRKHNANSQQKGKGSEQGGAPLSKAGAQFGQLVDRVAAALMNQGFAGQLITAMEAIVQSQHAEAPGKLIPGVISNLAGAIQLAGGGDPTTCMVFLNGSTVATPVYVPPHLQADIATGLQVWVRAANGRRDDLILDSIRAFTGTPFTSSIPASKVQPGTHPDGLFGFGVQGLNNSSGDVQSWQRKTNQPRTLFLGVGPGVGTVFGSFYVYDATSNQFIFAVDPTGLNTTGTVPVANVSGIAGHLVYWIAQQFVWGGQAITANGTVSVTVAGNYGVPANATAVYVATQYSSTTVGAFSTWKGASTNDGTSHVMILGNIQSSGQTLNTQGWIPLDGSGQITAWANQAGTIGMYILGYTV